MSIFMRYTIPCLKVTTNLDTQFHSMKNDHGLWVHVHNKNEAIYRGYFIQVVQVQTN